MQILRLNFLIYTVGGVWRPIAWSSNVAKFLYNVFTFCTIIPLYFLMLTQFMDLVLIVDNIDDFTTNSLMFMSVVAVCCKATIAVFRREEIISLVQMLLTEPCRPQDENEVAIQMKFNKFIRSWSIRYSLLATSSVTGVTVRSVLNMMHGILPYRVWLPYDSNVSLSFWITSILQTVSLIFATIINVGTETLIFGLFLQTCAQLEIFEKRLYKLVINKTTTRLTDKHGKRCSASYKKELISNYIHHHLSIYQYAKMVNSVFNQVLFVQFFVSILVLCTSVYYLSSHIQESEAATIIIYTVCMFLQIYIYCWSGNEVILKSASIGDAVYHTDWPLLSVSEKRDLLMIMKRSTIPIKFTSSFLVTLSLQSYGNILKTSYSSYNVLLQS
ncbi:odorant receptor 46a-like [Odontomachus brunneus]|uniref:odorant receptor 46a-like n=1 Tax=Odontomachus brunneus TaxID=486640 RepID=UPI0013F24113|nr:odorant receptor 46a-like [Odontomachus brunneus]